MTLTRNLTAETTPIATHLAHLLKDPSGTPLDRKVTLAVLAASAPWATLYATLVDVDPATLAADPAFTDAFIAKGQPFINVRDYGAVGDGVTDDTAAFQAAIDAIEAMAAFLRPALYVPQSSGRYRVTSLQVDFPGLVIFGAGRRASQIDCTSGAVASYSTSAGTLFNLDTFEVAPASFYAGVASDFTLRDLTLISTANNGVGFEGVRDTFAIQDNGGGRLSLTRVTISGFAIGLSLVYGSDFDVLNDVLISTCDTGVYLGPLSNQFALNEVEFVTCQDAVVVAGSPNGVFRSCFFIDSSRCDVGFEANTATRSGVAQASLPNFEGNIEMDNCWHESGVSPGRGPSEAHVWLYGDLNSLVPRNIKLRNPYVVAGGTLVAGSAFCQIDNDDAVIEIDRPNCWGPRLDYWVKVTSGDPTVILRDPTRDSTAATIENFTGTGANAHSIYSAAGEQVWLSAQDFLIQSASSPSPTGAGGVGTTAGWLFDATVVEQVSMMVLVPPAWASMAADIYWLNEAAGSGDVRLRLGIYTQAVGAATETAVSDTSATYTAGALNVMTKSAHVTGLTVVQGLPMCVRILRAGDDAADTLANDILFVGIMLRRLS